MKTQKSHLRLLVLLAWIIPVTLSAQLYTPWQLTDDPLGAGHASWSPDGFMIAYSSGEYGSRDIWVIPSSGGEPVQITAHPANDDMPDWSPDGSALAFCSGRSGNDDIWIYNMGDESLEQLTAHSGSDWYPKWSPDGSEIVFCSDRSGSFDIWKIPAGGGTAEPITDHFDTEWAPAWSPDGSKIAFVGFISGNNDLWTIASDGTGDPSQVTTYSGHDLLASWSPDGTELVFASDRSGNMDLWRIPATGGTATQITDGPADDVNPDWSYDGNYAAFGSDRNGCCDVWIVPLKPFTRITEGPQVNDGGKSVGVCWVDYDSDGYLDLYILNEEAESNFLYHNEGGGIYTRVTWEPLATDVTGSYGASWGDYDNDGDVDVVVANFKGDANVLYINHGFGGGFAPDEDCIISTEPAGSTSPSWVDYDLDGDLDLFIANSSNDLPEYPPYRNFLYANEGGVLTAVTSGEIVTLARHTYGNGWCDYDDDGDPDLVNSNNVYEPMDLFRNDHPGGFTRLPTSVLGTDTTNGGCVSWADFDNDGDMDLFIASFWPGPSLLYENEGNGVLTKINDHGVGLIDGRATGGIWGDYDNDGDLDIFVWLDDWQVPVNALGYIWQNDGTGIFTMLPADEFECDSCRSRSAVWGDHDRDGDLDLYAARVIYPESTNNFMYLNNGNSNNWIIIKLIGTLSNRSGIGAKIHLKANIDGSPVWQMRELSSQIGGHSQGPLELHFGLGDASLIDSIRVKWPSGVVDVLTDVAVNNFMTITETRCGDANNDESTNIGDVVYLINHIFHNGPAPPNAVAGDVNCDGGINVGDAVYLGNFIFQPAALRPCVSCN